MRCVHCRAVLKVFPSRWIDIDLQTMTCPANPYADEQGRTLLGMHEPDLSRTSVEKWLSR